MSTQKEIPNALRLADALDNGCNFYPESSQHFDRELSTAASDASAELRAQCGLIQTLKAALAMALPAVEHFKFLEDAAYGKNFSEFRSIKAHSDLRYVKEALAAAEAYK